jgi:hypothetical protein
MNAGQSTAKFVVLEFPARRRENENEIRQIREPIQGLQTTSRL